MRTDSPSYGYQLAQGATALTEAWDSNPNSSQDHFMLGHAEEWFYRGLAGIDFDLSRERDRRIGSILRSSATLAPHRQLTIRCSGRSARVGDARATRCIWTWSFLRAQPLPYRYRRSSSTRCSNPAAAFAAMRESSLSTRTQRSSHALWARERITLRHSDNRQERGCTRTTTNGWTSSTSLGRQRYFPRQWSCEASEAALARSYPLITPMFGRASEHSAVPADAGAGAISVVPAAQPPDSLTMQDPATFAEVKMDFPIGSGPFQPTWDSINANYPSDPAWLRDAKFGIWVHSGRNQRVRAATGTRARCINRARWPTRTICAKYRPPSASGYKETLHTWNPAKLDPVKLVQTYQDAGARFLLIQGVHHDNFDNWNSTYQPWNSVNLVRHRDLLGEPSKASRAAGMHFGVAFHHEYTWWWYQPAFGSDRQRSARGRSLRCPADAGRWHREVVA